MQPDQCIKLVCINLTARDGRDELLLTVGVFSTIFLANTPASRLLAKVVGDMLVMGAVLLGSRRFKSPMQGVIETETETSTVRQE